MAAFSLKSDKEFLTPLSDGQGVYVKTYEGDMNDIKITMISYYSDEHWACGGNTISATGYAPYDALEVFGTTIAGDKLRELCKELHAIVEARVCVYVNRIGHCIITELKHSSIKAMRINNYFGWSKYGVKSPLQNLISSSTMWNKFDMFSGETMLDVEAFVRAAGEAEKLRRSLEEKNVELVACKKEMEEMKVEIVLCKKEMELMKKNESLWRKLVEEKEKVDELMKKNHLLALRSNDH